MIRMDIYAPIIARHVVAECVELALIEAVDRPALMASAQLLRRRFRDAARAAAARALAAPAQRGAEAQPNQALSTPAAGLRSVPLPGSQLVSPPRQVDPHLEFLESSLAQWTAPTTGAHAPGHSASIARVTHLRAGPAATPPGPAPSLWQLASAASPPQPSAGAPRPSARPAHPGAAPSTAELRRSVLHTVASVGRRGTVHTHRRAPRAQAEADSAQEATRRRPAARAPPNPAAVAPPAQLRARPGRRGEPGGQGTAAAGGSRPSSASRRLTAPAAAARPLTARPALAASPGGDAPFEQQLRRARSRERGVGGAFESRYPRQRSSPQPAAAAPSSRCRSRSRGASRARPDDQRRTPERLSRPRARSGSRDDSGGGGSGCGLDGGGEHLDAHVSPREVLARWKRQLREYSPPHAPHPAAAAATTALPHPHEAAVERLHAAALAAAAGVARRAAAAVAARPAPDAPGAWRAAHERRASPAHSPAWPEAPTSAPPWRDLTGAALASPGASSAGASPRRAEGALTAAAPGARIEEGEEEEEEEDATRPPPSPVPSHAQPASSPPPLPPAPEAAGPSAASPMALDGGIVGVAASVPLPPPRWPSATAPTPAPAPAAAEAHAERTSPQQPPAAPVPSAAYAEFRAAASRLLAQDDELDLRVEPLLARPAQPEAAAPRAHAAQAPPDDADADLDDGEEEALLGGAAPLALHRVGGGFKSHNASSYAAKHRIRRVHSHSHSHALVPSASL